MCDEMGGDEYQIFGRLRLTKEWVEKDVLEEVLQNTNVIF